ncbi:flagellar assembly protein H [Arsenicitalea aurantiaca]|uniref:Flagellar assembly protein H n=1 Tax=Arsenicitalea aurantiaca TaxID=1783274 RepID=A0A433XKW4_9HYPH|nr:FliH/SctL family protein [Arsenicitalea aurantiaca]RUT34719.1 flagellar assembly protein H [Arsenicitalea aurantiaca]
MANAARFTFDLDLGTGQSRHPQMSREAADQNAQEARMAGYAEGYAEAERKARISDARRLATATEALAGRIDALIERQNAEADGLRAGAIALARSVAGKLSGHLLAREPQAELEALLGECLSSLDKVPHLVIRCHPDLVDTLEPLARRRADASHFEGRLVILPDEAIAIGDGRIEWADGGLVRDSATIESAIDDAITAYLAARGTNRGDQE